MFARPRTAILAGVAVVLSTLSTPARSGDHELVGPKPPCASAPHAPSQAETALPATPHVSLSVRVVSQAEARQEIEYRLLVENRSQAVAHHVLIRNPLPDHAKFVRASPEPYANNPELLWRLGTLEAGARNEIVLILAPTGTGDVTNCARVQFEHGQCVTTHIARPGLTLRKIGPPEAQVGDVLTYEITVTNSGDADAAGVVLNDVLPPGLAHATGRTTLTWEVGKLLPGQSAVLNYQVTAKSGGKHCNKVVATGTAGLKAAAENCVTIAAPKLGVTMTGPTERILTLAATYQITVTNSGTLAAHDAVLHNPIPAQAQFVSASAGGELRGNLVEWKLGTLEAGATRTFELELRGQSRGRICNRAQLTAARGLSAEAEFCTDFIGEPGVLLELVDTDDPVETGGLTRYIITVRNQGQIPLTNVVILATAPPQLAVNRVTGPGEHKLDGARVLFAPISIPTGQDARYEIEAKALLPGDARFRVELTADQLQTGGAVHEEESTTIVRDLPVSLRRRQP